MMKRTKLVLASLVVVAGCSKKTDSAGSSPSSPPAPAPTAKTTEPPAPRVEDKKPAAQAQGLTPEFFGKGPAPIGALAKLEWDMPADDARKVAPDLISAKPGESAVKIDPAITGVRYTVGLGDHTNRIDHLAVAVPSNAKDTIEKAWGPGKAAKDSIDRPRTYWFNPDTGWRAYLEAGYGDDLSLDLRPYVPAAKLLGDAPDKLGFAPDGILGATIEELRTRFGARLVETDEATAAKQQADLSKFSGVDVKSKVGAAKPSVQIDLAPTEWGEFWTRVQVDWGKDGKVDHISFDLPYGAYEPAKEEMREAFEQHWGKPKPGKYLIHDVDVYRAKGPWIAVEDNTIMHAWTVHVHQKAPN